MVENRITRTFPQIKKKRQLGAELSVSGFAPNNG